VGALLFPIFSPAGTPGFFALLLRPAPCRLQEIFPRHLQTAPFCLSAPGNRALAYAGIHPLVAGAFAPHLNSRFLQIRSLFWGSTGAAQGDTAFGSRHPIAPQPQARPLRVALLEQAWAGTVLPLSGQRYRQATFDRQQPSWLSSWQAGQDP
jgi:hypothetical protein